MKTSMQELIEIIKDKRKESDISNTLLRFCKVEAEKLLEKEKQQIIDAWCQNAWIGNVPIKERAEQYYNETFN